MKLFVEIDWYIFKICKQGDMPKKSKIWRIKIINDYNEVIKDIRVIQIHQKAIQEFQDLKKMYPKARIEIKDLTK